MADKKKTELKISGMSCATCAITVEKSLAGVKGVSKAEVSSGTEIATVEYDPSKVSLADLEKAVVDAGYGVENQKAVIKVGGMTCAMCVQTIEAALRQLEGVTEANVNLGAEKAYVTYNPRVTSVAAMKKAIEETGYQYLGVAGEDTEEMERAAREKDLRLKKRRLWVGFGVGIPLMILTFLLGSWSFLSYFMLIVATPAFAYVSYPIFNAAYRALRNRALDMDVMYGMGIGVAYIASVMGTFNIVLTRDFQFYETAVLLAAFLTLGRFLEARAKGRTGEAIKKLMGLQAKTAIVMRNDVETEVPVEDVQVGDVVLVKPGEKIPVDGEVVFGESYIDEAMVTGEPLPALKKAGSTVIGGTFNQNSVIRFKATKIGKDTLLSQIINLVEEAQGSKPPAQRLADRVVTWFIPVVLTIALATFAGWYFLGHTPLLFALTTLISILVIACPCALGLATPTAVTVGVGRGAELGILIKNGEALETADKLTTIIFDKTGTLTKGKPEVTDIISTGMDKKELLRLAASVEKNSQHPLGDAVVRKAQEEGLELGEVENFDTYSGKGVLGRTGGRNLVIGNRALLSEKFIAITKDEEDSVLKLESDGKTVALVVVDGRLRGLIAIADTLKETTGEAIKAFKDMGLKVIMITGDNARTANAIAGQIGIDNVLAEVLPQDKVNEVKKLQEQGEVVAFIGDGINDAPALAQADVGIAVGGGTDIAMESGQAVLMRNDLLDAVAAVQLSKKVMSRIKQNLFWAFAYNVALIPLAAGLLYPFFGITFRPEFAGLAMALSSVTVVSLSLLLRTYVPPVRKQSAA